MFNLKEGGGSFKGLIGECMFKLTNKEVVITKFFNKSKYFNTFGKYFTPEQHSFLENNWYSIDAIEVKFSNNVKNIILYEIKTRNKYNYELPFLPKMTLETHRIYHSAKSLGFVPKIAIVWLYDSWNYDIELKEFDEKEYSIDRPKQYDFRRGN